MSVVFEVVDLESLEVTIRVVVSFKDAIVEIIIANSLIVLVLTPFFPLVVKVIIVVIIPEVFSKVHGEI